MEMFFVAGISIAVFIEFLLISKKNKSTPDKILTVWMFVILVHIFLFYLYFTGNIYSVPFLLGIEHPIPILHGVFLFLYASFLTNQLPEKRYVLYFHFIPAILMYLYLIDFFILSSEQKIYVYQNRGVGYESFIIIRNYAITFSGIIYVIWTFILLRDHRKNMSNQFSNLQKVDLRWLLFLTIGMGVIWFLIIVFDNELFTFGGVVIFVFLIGFFGIGQTNIFVQYSKSESDTEQKKKYQKSGLTEELSNKLHKSLLELMSKEELYKNSELSIGDLSSRLNVHSNYLSQIINEREGKNFYDFVNLYRVEEFKRLIALPKNQHLTLLSVAFDCGFNSKSSFNRYFKKATGKTPSEYFETIKSEETSSRTSI